MYNMCIGFNGLNFKKVKLNLLRLVENFKQFCFNVVENNVEKVKLHQHGKLGNTCRAQPSAKASRYLHFVILLFLENVDHTPRIIEN